MRPRYFPRRSAPRPPVRGLAPALASALALPWLLAGCSTAALQHPPSLQALMMVAAAVVLVNTALTFALLWGWERLVRRRRHREALLRELRHLRPWATAEGVLRKAGLLRDLNALGASPPDLDGCELEGADLRGVGLAGCSLRGANLAGANLQGADLDAADLFGATLSGANLALASLRGTNLRGCDLDGAALIKAQLQRANLHRASLVHTNLQGAALEGTRLTLARFLRPEEGGFQLTVHPSVEDWIRARLASDGRYREAADRPPPVALPDVG